ncbi:MAG: siphovirus Gp157 family protein [Cyanobacterium sp. T60_A2020_053]|nr:siphovirus Gp157 family protein [Cyanobacterium sp. T60_A2020_053]
MKLYELTEKLTELEETIENLDGIDIPADLHSYFLSLLSEAESTNEEFLLKIDDILSLIQSRKYWLEVRKNEQKRLNTLIKRDEKTVEWLQEYLKHHLEKLNLKKLRTNKFNVTVRQASVPPLNLFEEDATKYPKQYQKVTVEVDRKALKEAIKQGDEEAIKYGKLGEKSTYLSIK